MPKIALIVLKPRKDKTKQLITLLKESMVTLQRLGIASGREQIIAESKDGFLIHIFEWATEDSQDVASEHSEVRDLWMRAAKLSDFQKPNTIKEFDELFPTLNMIS